MDHFVPLSALPADFRRIPPDLSERFRYDAEQKRLSFQGFMSKGDFDRLSLLSESWPYKRAVESLFMICTLDDDQPKALSGLRKILASLGLL